MWPSEAVASRFGSGAVAAEPLPARRSAPLRFPSLADLYESFPTARADIGLDPTRRPILDSVAEAVERAQWAAALSCMAYLLPRRVAVHWASQALRRMMRQVPGAEALDAADAWIRRPDEEARQEALRVGSAGDGRRPATWVALAAGWSGGSIAPAACGPIAARPEQGPKAVRAALIMALAQMPEDLRDPLMRACLADAVALACDPRAQA